MGPKRQMFIKNDYVNRIKTGSNCAFTNYSISAKRTIKRRIKQLEHEGFKIKEINSLQEILLMANKPIQQPHKTIYIFNNFPKIVRELQQKKKSIWDIKQMGDTNGSLVFFGDNVNRPDGLGGFFDETNTEEYIPNTIGEPDKDIQDQTPPPTVLPLTLSQRLFSFWSLLIGKLSNTSIKSFTFIISNYFMLLKKSLPSDFVNVKNGVFFGLPFGTSASLIGFFWVQKDVDSIAITIICLILYFFIYLFIIGPILKLIFP